MAIRQKISYDLLVGTCRVCAHQGLILIVQLVRSGRFCAPAYQCMKALRHDLKTYSSRRFLTGKKEEWGSRMGKRIVVERLSRLSWIVFDFNLRERETGSDVTLPGPSLVSSKRMQFLAATKPMNPGAVTLKLLPVVGYGYHHRPGGRCRALVSTSYLWYVHSDLHTLTLPGNLWESHKTRDGGWSAPCHAEYPC